MKKIAVIGSGYVGLVAAACFSEIGHEVICIDKQSDKIESLEKNIIPIYEPSLKELVIKNKAQQRLFFSTDLIFSCQKSDIIFIAVGTPPDEKNGGEADLKNVFEVAKNLAENINGYKIVVNKSTVPVGTGEKIQEIFKTYSKDFDVVSNPEFLREGVAIEDFMKPDRVVLGVANQKSKQEMLAVYQPLMTLNQEREIIYYMDIKSAEMTKYVANSMLACRISFINEIAELCRKVNADIDQVKKGVGSDSRIGRHFLSSGIGYGGSCFPKDVQAILKTAKDFGVDFSILEAVQKRNQQQKELIVEQIKKDFGTNLAGKRFTIWGLAFKPETDDIREAPAITIIEKLLQLGAEIHAHDEQAILNTENYFKKEFEKNSEQKKNLEKLFFHKEKYLALKESDALLLCTEWRQYYEVDFKKIAATMRGKHLYDGRRIWVQWVEKNYQNDNSFIWWN